MARPSVVVLAALCLAFVATSAPAADSSRQVTRVLIRKGDHTLTLFAGDELVASYGVAIGPGGIGPKRMAGDMTTPIGRYHVVSHQPSQYRTFLRLDYPTVADWRRFNAAKERGDLPRSAKIGSDIGIHGPPVSMSESERASLKAHDWTAGCIAVDDAEIAEIARLVRDGTVVDIEP